MSFKQLVRVSKDNQLPKIKSRLYLKLLHIYTFLPVKASWLSGFFYKGKASWGSSFSWIQRARGHSGLDSICRYCIVCAHQQFQGDPAQSSHFQHWTQVTQPLWRRILRVKVTQWKRVQLPDSDYKAGTNSYMSSLFFQYNLRSSLDIRRERK